MNIRFHSSIVKVIRGNSFRVTDDDVAKLADTKVASDSVGDVLGDDYFRVLLRRVTDEYGITPGNQGDLIDTHAKHMLGVVADRVITDDIKANPEDSTEVKADKTKKRGQRTQFARSAASVLRRFVKAGGFVGNLDPEVHGKSAVDTEAKRLEAEATAENGEAEAETSGKSPAEKCMSRLASLLTAVRQLSELDRDEARAFVETAKRELDGAVS
jgi:hypothetical protein